MRRFRTTLLLCAMALLWTVDGAQAQEAATPPPENPVTYRYQDEALLTPRSVRQVRRHVARLGLRSPRRISYPVIVVVAPSGSPAPSRLPAAPLPAPRRADPAPDPTPAPAPTPTIVEVERALLETGLFRTIDVVFRFDQSTLLPVSEATLDAVGEVMVRYPALRLEVSGHTDNVGAAAYNQQLSEERARAVQQYLLDHFPLARGRLTAQGFGETQPVASNDDATGRTLNRRVEFRVINR